MFIKSCLDVNVTQKVSAVTCQRFECITCNVDVNEVNAVKNTYHAKHTAPIHTQPNGYISKPQMSSKPIQQSRTRCITAAATSLRHHSQILQNEFYLVLKPM